MRHSTRIKDEEGYPAFALVNKVTGEAIKHSLGQSHPVRTIHHSSVFTSTNQPMHTNNLACVCNATFFLFLLVLLSVKSI